MLGPARQSAILKAVTARGSCTVSDLARELDVSGETIRRDIRVMARQGLVRKVHGGVSVPDHVISALEPYREDPKGFQEKSADLAAEQIRGLIEMVTRHFHIYALNKSDIVLRIAKRMGWEK